MPKQKIGLQLSMMKTAKSYRPITGEENMLERKISSIIYKIRQIYKYYNRIRNLIKKNANVELIVDDNTMVIHCVSFSDYDKLYIYSNRIVFAPEIGHPEVLLKYASWSELLNM